MNKWLRARREIVPGIPGATALEVLSAHPWADCIVPLGDGRYIVRTYTIAERRRREALEDEKPD